MELISEPLPLGEKERIGPAFFLLNFLLIFVVNFVVIFVVIFLNFVANFVVNFVVNFVGRYLAIESARGGFPACCPLLTCAWLDFRTICRLEIGDTAGWKPALRVGTFRGRLSPALDPTLSPSGGLAESKGIKMFSLERTPGMALLVRGDDLEIPELD
jgi:hypothetical protein